MYVCKDFDFDSYVYFKYILVMNLKMSISKQSIAKGIDLIN